MADGIIRVVGEVLPSSCGLMIAVACVVASANATMLVLLSIVITSSLTLSSS